MQYVWYLNRENVGQKSLIEGKDDDYDFNPGWVNVGPAHCKVVTVVFLDKVPAKRDER